MNNADRNVKVPTCSGLYIKTVAKVRVLTTLSRAGNSAITLVALNSNLVSLASSNTNSSQNIKIALYLKNTERNFKFQTYSSKQWQSFNYLQRSRAGNLAITFKLVPYLNNADRKFKDQTCFALDIKTAAKAEVE